MTDVRQRPGAAPAAVTPSVVLHGSLVAAAAALSGLATLAAVVLVAWVADAGPGSTGTDAVRAAADAWLLAHGGGLTVPAGHVRGIPLGLTVLAAVVLHRAGASLARTVEVPDLRAAGRAVAALAIPYGLVAAAVAKVAATGTAASSAPLAGFGALLLATLAGGRGVLRAAGLGPALARRLPPWLPSVGRAVVTGVGALLAAGLALLLVALVWHAGKVAELVGALQPGLVGGIVLLLGCAMLLPNGALWAVAYAAGPGFTVGAGTGVSPFGATLGPVPSFPLLAALPADGTPAPLVRAALVLPVLAGVLAGWVVGRRLPAATGAGRGAAVPTGRVARLAAYGLLAGVLVALGDRRAGGAGRRRARPRLPGRGRTVRLAGRGRARSGGRRPGRGHRGAGPRPRPGPHRRPRPRFPAKSRPRADRGADRKTDGKADRKTDGKTDGKTGGKTDGKTGGKTDGDAVGAEDAADDGDGDPHRERESGTQ